MSDAVASVLNLRLKDSVLVSVESTISNIKSAMKNKQKEKENRTPSVYNKKKPTRKGTGLKGASTLVTPKHLQPRQVKTPMITPKFDTSRVMRSGVQGGKGKVGGFGGTIRSVNVLKSTTNWLFWYFLHIGNL